MWDFIDTSSSYNDRPLPLNTARERFFAKVQKTNNCWVWTGCKNNRGYGQLRMGRETSLLASRLSFFFHKGPIQKGLYICHSCDNPPCVNPDHLEAGTQRKNVIDAYKRGRIPLRANGKYSKSKGENI